LDSDMDNRTTELQKINERLRHELARRRQAEEALEAERCRFKEVLELLPAYVVLLTPDYHVPFANRFFRERFGESHGRRCFEYLFDLSEPCENCETFKVLKTNAPHHWEWTGPDCRNYDIFDFPFSDSDGSPMIMEIGIDLTDYKRAEEEVRRANVYNRSLIEASPDPLVTIGSDGGITDVNGATESATGFDRDELIGTDFSDYFTEPGKARAGYQQVFRDGIVRDYPLEILNRDGHVTHVLYNASVFRNESGEVAGVFAAARDITARKLAEARIVRQNTILNAINQVFREAFCCETEEMLGRKCLAIAEALTGSEFGFIIRINPAGRADAIALSDPGWEACRMPENNAVLLLRDMEVRGIWSGVFRHGRSIITNDPPAHPDWIGIPEGHPAVTCFLGVPMEQAGSTIALIGLANKPGGYGDSDREAVELLAVAIVESLMRKRAEDEIRKLNTELEQRVAERTNQLEASNKELEAFAYSVSHDLRAPLRSIDGFSLALLEDFAGELDDQGKDYLRRVRYASQRMSVLIDDMLRLSWIARTEMKPEEVDLCAMAYAISRQLSESSPDRSVDFSVTDDLKVMGDPRLLHVAMENLLGNAWKFTSKHETAKIEVGMDSKDGETVYFVRDNGAGFDMAYVDKLFSPFQRLHSEQDYPGTGIGLSIVQRIIQRHGGKAWAEGEPGRGATFYFTLGG